MSSVTSTRYPPRSRLWLIEEREFRRTKAPKNIVSRFAPQAIVLCLNIWTSFRAQKTRHNLSWHSRPSRNFRSSIPRDVIYALPPDRCREIVIRAGGTNISLSLLFLSLSRVYFPSTRSVHAIGGLYRDAICILIRRGPARREFQPRGQEYNRGVVVSLCKIRKGL